MAVFRILLVIAVFLLPLIGNAQPGNPGGDPDVPISGIEWLIGGGVMLGLRRIIKKKK